MAWVQEGIQPSFTGILIQMEMRQTTATQAMDIKKDLLKLSEAVFEAVLKLRETAMVLSYGSTKAMEKAKDVEVAERVVDELYRELEIKLLNSKLDFPALILLRDVLQLLEDSADKAEDAADAARILSFIL